jgi:photosystem II stability/assembly factor-like uncharacterized protein
VIGAAEIGSGHSAIAVGSAGTVVAWGYRATEMWVVGERFVETSTVADVYLRGVADAGGGRWVVVGDGGFAALSDDLGQTWTTLDLQTSADLHAVLAVSESVVVVGDGVVRVLQGDTWLEPPTPEGGWGQLRGIGWSYPYPYPDKDPRTFAVGLAGVIWSTDDPSGVWVAEDSGVDVDLFAVGRLQGLVGVVGANGTFLIREGADEWISIETKRTVDFVDYQDLDPYGLLLAADGEVLQYHRIEGFQYLDRFEGAQDLAFSSSYGFDGLIAVGDAGMAVSKIHGWCE